MYNLGLKLGSLDTQYTPEILQYYEQGLFQYIELFAVSETFNNTISYWKQFNIPFGIHAPHSAAGLNLANSASRKNNRTKIEESLKFADTLNAKYIIFHSGTNGTPEETIKQLQPLADERFLIENKPIRGLDGSTCVGCVYEDLKQIIDGIKNGCGFCLDFGHAICAANTLKKDPFDFIKKLYALNPRVYHLTDGVLSSDLDGHLHYGEGDFPLKELLAMVPDGGMITNESKRSHFDCIEEFRTDSVFLRNLVKDTIFSRNTGDLK
jgi:sugar phosphate isomerase/epimerase